MKPEQVPDRHDAVLVFVREPVEGRVKMRLAASIGARPALRIYRRLAERAVDESVSLGPEVTVRIEFTPPTARRAMAEWLGGGVTYVPQVDGGFGERLARAFDDAFAAGFTRVVAIGSDLPEISTARLRAALDALADHDAVIGPARDGGYWLLGLRRLVPSIFSGIPWSTPKVLGLTIGRLREVGAEPAILDALNDVDERDDLPAGWIEWATRGGTTGRR